MNNIDFQWLPGRVKLDEVIISNTKEKVDVTDLFLELNLNSFINGPSVSAEFVFADAGNTIDKFKINGGDSITINVSYKNETKNFKFKVVGIENITNEGQFKTYVLRCMSFLAFDSIHIGIIKGYSGTVSEIARQVFDEFVDPEIEKINNWIQSSNKASYVIPNWSILYTLQWLASKAIWDKDAVRFRFFQDSNLRYNFMPIEKAIDFYKDKPAFKYTHNLVVGTKGEQQAPNSQDALRAVKDIDFETSFDIQRSLANGKITGIRYAPDIITKNYTPFTYNYFENFNKENYLNSYPQFRSSTFSPAKNQYDILTSLIYDEDNPNKGNDISNIRFSNLDDTQMVTIEVVGNSVVDIGQIIDLEVAAIEPQSKNNNRIDKRWSGLYYVISKRDIFSKRDEMHRMVLGIAKESQIEGVET